MFALYRSPYYYIDGKSVGDNNWTTYGFRELDETSSPFNISDLSSKR
jgi:hypothetical protein